MQEPQAQYFQSRKLQIAEQVIGGCRGLPCCLLLLISIEVCICNCNCILLTSSLTSFLMSSY